MGSSRSGHNQWEWKKTQHCAGRSGHFALHASGLLGAAQLLAGSWAAGSECGAGGLARCLQLVAPDGVQQLLEVVRYTQVQAAIQSQVGQLQPLLRMPQRIGSQGRCSSGLGARWGDGAAGGNTNPSTGGSVRRLPQLPWLVHACRRRQQLVVVCGRHWLQLCRRKFCKPCRLLLQLLPARRAGLPHLLGRCRMAGRLRRQLCCRAADGRLGSAAKLLVHKVGAAHGQRRPGPLVAVHCWRSHHHLQGACTQPMLHRRRLLALPLCAAAACQVQLLLPLRRHHQRVQRWRWQPHMPCCRACGWPLGWRAGQLDDVLDGSRASSRSDGVEQDQHGCRYGAFGRAELLSEDARRAPAEAGRRKRMDGSVCWQGPTWFVVAMHATVNEGFRNDCR